MLDTLSRGTPVSPGRCFQRRSCLYIHKITDQSWEAYVWQKQTTLSILTRCTIIYCPSVSACRNTHTFIISTLISKDHNHIQKMQHPHAFRQRTVTDTNWARNRAVDGSCCKNLWVYEVLAFSIGSRSSSSVIWHMCITVVQSKARGTTITKTEAEALHISDYLTLNHVCRFFFCSI